MAVNRFKEEILSILPRKIDECNYKGNVDDIKHLSALFFRPNAKGATDFVGKDRETIRKYIFDNEEDMYDVCRIGISRGDVSSLMYAMRVKNPHDFLAYTAYAASTEILRSTPLVNVRDFKLDAETKALLKDELKLAQLDYKDMYSSLILSNKFKDAAYDLYRKDWLREQGSSLREERETILTLLKNGKKEFGKDYTLQDAEDCYQNSYGINGSGQIYACRDEFLDTEYNYKPYMKYLLPPKMYRVYQLIEFEIDKEEEPKSVSTHIEPWEQEAAEYLKSLNSNKAVGCEFISLHEFLDELGVSKEKHNDCYKLLKDTHFGKYEGDFSIEKCGVVPVKFTKALEEDFTYAVNHLVREKKFMNYIPQFKQHIYENACRYWDLSESAGLKENFVVSRNQFDKDVFNDISKVAPYMSYTDRQIWNKVQGIPYKETKQDVLIFTDSHNKLYKLDAGKMWRDIDLKYDGRKRDGLYEQMDIIVSAFRCGQMQTVDGLFKDSAMNALYDDYLLKLQSKYMHTSMVKDNKKLKDVEAVKEKSDLGR